MARQYTHPLGWKDNVNFPTTPSDEAHARALLQEQHDEILQFHNELLEDYEGHKTKAISQMIFELRDISLSGVQTITGLSGTPKRIEVRATIYNFETLSHSVGSYETEGSAQSCSAMYNLVSGKTISYFNNSAAIVVLKDENNWVLGTIQNVTETQFEINWQVQSGMPTGIVNLQIIVHYH